MARKLIALRVWMASYAALVIATAAHAQTPTPTVACPVETLSGALPLMRNRATTDVESRMESGECGGGGPERTFSFTAPTSSIYEFDTVGTSFDTVLYLLRDSCSGEEIACNDDQNDDNLDSRVTAYLDAGQTVVIVVDGYSDLEFGPLTLRVRRPACPATPVQGTFPMVINGTTTGGPSNEIGSCGGGGRERTFLLSAPADGTFTFDTAGSSYPVVLHLKDDSCFGEELDCSASDEISAAYLVQGVYRGDTVVAMVDGDPGNLGAFKLTVNFELDPPTPTVTPTFDTATPTVTATPGGPCGEVLSSVLPITVAASTAGWPSETRGTCAGAGRERAYIFTAPSTATYTIDTNGSVLDTILYVRHLNCDGVELGCDDEGGSTFGASQIVLSLTQGQVVAIYVDGYFAGDGAAFALHIDVEESGPPTSTPTPTLTVEIATPTATVVRTCPDAELDVPLPIEHAGSNGDLPPSQVGSCGGSGPEVVYRFTAPAAATYRIDTRGAGFDTVLYVRQGSCDGGELACNDDFGGSTSSRLEVSLVAGETVVIVVDTYSGIGGSFPLYVEEVVPRTCLGDCDSDGLITSSDLERIRLTILNCTCQAGGVPGGIAEGCEAAPGCLAADFNNDGCLSAGELARLSRNALLYTDGCETP